MRISRFWCRIHSCDVFLGFIKENRSLKCVAKSDNYLNFNSNQSSHCQQTAYQAQQPTCHPFHTRHKRNVPESPLSQRTYDNKSTSSETIPSYTDL